jgi:carboxypeptidase Taq
MGKVISKDRAYSKLVTELKRLRTLRSISSVLGWDEQVYLPSGSADLRADQFAALGELVHKESSSAKLGRMIESLEAVQGELSFDERRVAEVARRDFDQATKLPRSFVKRKAENDSRSYHAWAKARTEGTYRDFEPMLARQIDTAVEQASLLGRSCDAYSYWIDQFDPGMDLATVESIFTPLERELVPLVREIAGEFAGHKSVELKGFAIADQRALLMEVLKAMGFDFNHGRIDETLHPFCDGDGRDVRLTTRYDENNPLDSLFSAMHECGHGLYEQGLPTDLAGTALGDSAGMGIHESQSRIWENQVGRCRAFWKFWEPKYRERFPQLKNVSSEELYLAINHVKIGAVRIDSDEVTYNLHILLRFNIEKALFSGRITAKDLPEAWNNGCKELLGITPANDREGCMQDVHWASGLFGYFPSYTLGNLLAAQLWQKARSEMPDMDESMTKGNLAPILKWLRINVHSQARRYTTNGLSSKICGANLSHRALISYIKDRYCPLYHKITLQ